MLGILGLPFEQTLGPFLRRYRDQKARIVFAIVLVLMLGFALGRFLGPIVAIEALAVAELMERRKQTFEVTLAGIFVPALYLFVVVVLVFAYGHAIVAARYFETYDPTFNRLDWLLFHVNVSGIAHWCVNHLPHAYLKLLEIDYLELFSRIGAVLLLCSLLRGGGYALRHVRAISIGYAIALLIYLILPAKGPYAICATHDVMYPHFLGSFWAQKALVSKAQLLSAHHITSASAMVDLVDYYISFPSMHAALPIFGIWYIRPWRGIFWILLSIYLLVLLPSLIMLEWHYVIDLFGGFMTAALAIWITETISTPKVAAVQVESELVAASISH